MNNRRVKGQGRLRRGLDLIPSTLTLDPFDINYAYGSERLDILSLPSARLPRPGVLVRIVVFFDQFRLSLARLLSRARADPPSPGSAVFLFATMNQRMSLDPIASISTQGSLIDVGLDRSNREGIAYQFPVALCFLASLPFLPLVLYKLLRSAGYQRRSFNYALDSYWMSYGCYFVARLWLHRKGIRAVIAATDHDAVIRAMVTAAIHEGVPTFYVQHASVTSSFPPLFFDYALLEGREALDSYERAGPSQTRVFLVGMPKIDAHLAHANDHETARAIGVGTNTLDPVGRVAELCGRVRLEMPDLPMILRPHPRDRRSGVWIELAHKYQMELSDPRLEQPLEFLRRVDVLIAGDSNLHLDAVLMNVYAIYYDFDSSHRDYYGFQRNGLVEYLADMTGICDRLRELARSKPPVQMRAKPYCATIGTPHHGRSSLLAASIIDEVVSRGQVHLQPWTRIPGTELRAYELSSPRSR